MRIDVHAHCDCDDQTRAYAEYRVFSALRHFSDIVREATVMLMPTDADSTDRPGVACRVVITMTHDRHLETAARGRHAYAVIDRVAGRIQSLMDRQPSGVS